MTILSSLVRCSSISVPSYLQVQSRQLNGAYDVLYGRSTRWEGTDPLQEARARTRMVCLGRTTTTGRPRILSNRASVRVTKRTLAG